VLDNNQINPSPNRIHKHVCLHKVKRRAILNPVHAIKTNLNGIGKKMLDSWRITYCEMISSLCAHWEQLLRRILNKHKSHCRSYEWVELYHYSPYTIPLWRGQGQLSSHLHFDHDKVREIRIKNKKCITITWTCVQSPCSRDGSSLSGGNALFFSGLLNTGLNGFLLIVCNVSENNHAYIKLYQV